MKKLHILCASEYNSLPPLSLACEIEYNHMYGYSLRLGTRSTNKRWRANYELSSARRDHANCPATVKLADWITDRYYKEPPFVSHGGYPNKDVLLADLSKHNALVTEKHGKSIEIATLKNLPLGV